MVEVPVVDAMLVGAALSGVVVVEATLVNNEAFIGILVIG
jgi:hypothetical protein